MRINKALLLISSVPLLALVVLVFRPSWTPRIDAPNSIASLEDIAIGGVQQSILIRGVDQSLPILLWLHGGPGGTMMPVANVFGRELEKHFVVVHWDQRGSGRSIQNAVSAESLNLEQFLSDTHELIEILRSRFRTDRIFLVGHSWGSVLGLITAQRHPELLHAYIGIGQATNQRRSEQMGLAWVRDRALALQNDKALSELAELRPPYLEDPQKLVIQRRWLNRFGGQVYKGKPFLFWADIDRDWALSALRAPEYSWLDLIRYVNASQRIRWALFRDFKQVNFMATIPRVEVPVYLLMGRHDYNMQPSLVEEYYNLLDAPAGKSLIWFENSAHAPCLEEPARFLETMVMRVLVETLDAGVSN